MPQRHVRPSFNRILDEIVLKPFSRRGHDAIRAKARCMIHEFVISDPGILQGEPVFLGTSVSVETFLLYRRGDTPVYEFLLDYPSVNPRHAKRLARWLAVQDAETVRTQLEHIRMRQPHTVD